MTNNKKQNKLRKTSLPTPRAFGLFFLFSLFTFHLSSCWLEGDIDAFFDEAEKEAGKKVTKAYEMISIPAGIFTMGSPAGEIGRFTDEGPQRRVTLSAFKMGKYQVTQEQWQAVMGANPSYFHGGKDRKPASGEVQERRPVETVSWYDALVFCNKLSKLEGLSPAYIINGSTDPEKWGAVPTIKNNTWDAAVIVSNSNGYRLPTEAQWEYACRADTNTAFNDDVTEAWNNSTAVNKLGWYSSNSSSRTHEVGKKSPNRWGLYDMHGNVYEWCRDRFASSYPVNAETDPIGPVNGDYRVIRGGEYGLAVQHARSASRSFDSPNTRSIFIGLRVVLPE